MLPDEEDVTWRLHDYAKDCGTVPSGSRPQRLKTAHRRQSVAMWCPFPPRMSGKESQSDYIRGILTSVEGMANSSTSLPSLNPSTSSHLVLYPSQCNPSDKQE